MLAEARESSKKFHFCRIAVHKPQISATSHKRRKLPFQLYNNCSLVNTEPCNYIQNSPWVSKMFKIISQKQQQENYITIISQNMHYSNNSPFVEYSTVNPRLFKSMIYGSLLNKSVSSHCLYTRAHECVCMYTCML